MSPRRGERGAAAVELALVVPAVLALLALLGPLLVLLHTQLVIGSTAGDAVRFATSRTDHARTVGAVELPPGMLPNALLVQEEAARAYDDARGRRFLPADVRTTVQDSAAAADTCPAGRRRTVRIEADVDLGAFSFLSLGSTTKTLTASATSCEE